MVSCVICMRPSQGARVLEIHKSVSQYTQQWAVLGILLKCVGTRIISLRPLNTMQGVLLCAFDQRGN